MTARTLPAFVSQVLAADTAGLPKPVPISSFIPGLSVRRQGSSDLQTIPPVCLQHRSGIKSGPTALSVRLHSPPSVPFSGASSREGGFSLNDRTGPTLHRQA